LNLAELIKKLGERIRYIRKEKGLSQEQLGEVSGLHPNFIGAIERGEKNVTVESLVRIAAGLDISMEQLFRYIDPMEKTDALGEIHELLEQRSGEDRKLILQLIKTVFEWEKEKYR
jgi:transcriptional regulator with XRE-family HTH domain